MKVYKLPTELPAPQPDYKNFDFDKQKQAEDSHAKALTMWLIENGWAGPNTGRIYCSQIADGYSCYMFADGPKSCLIHLPYGDGWHDRDVEFLSKREVIKRMDQWDKRTSLFAMRKGK